MKSWLLFNGLIDSNLSLVYLGGIAAPYKYIFIMIYIGIHCFVSTLVVAHDGKWREDHSC